eukprot:915014-Amphidinium_carterae.1
MLGFGAATLPTLVAQQVIRGFQRALPRYVLEPDAAPQQRNGRPFVVACSPHCVAPCWCTSVVPQRSLNGFG